MWCVSSILCLMNERFLLLWLLECERDDVFKIYFVGVRKNMEKKKISVWYDMNVV